MNINLRSYHITILAIAIEGPTLSCKGERTYYLNLVSMKSPAIISIRIYCILTERSFLSPFLKIMSNTEDIEGILAIDGRTAGTIASSIQST